MEQFRADVRLALRGLARKPGSALLIIVTLAVGIAVNTVVFSLVNGLLFKRVPFADRDRLAWINAHTRADHYGQLTYPEFVALSGATRTFQQIIGEGRVPLAVKTANGTETEQVWSLIVSDNYFTTLGVTPIRGRAFDANTLGTSGADAAVLVTEAFWRQQFGEDTSLAGRTITLNNRVFSIAGVMPSGTRGFGGTYAPDMWVPLSSLDAVGLSKLANPDTPGWLITAGRLAPGQSDAQARDELKALSVRIPTRGGTNTDTTQSARDARTFTVISMRSGSPQLAVLRQLSAVAMAAVGLVLLVACFNVAGLLLARAHERRREMGVRAALGASAGRLARQQVTELLVLATLSGLAALLAGAWSYQLLHAFRLPAPVPQALDVSLDWRACLFTAALVLAAAGIPSLAPIWHIRGLDIVRVLKTDGRTSPALRSPLRRGLLIAQVAGSTMLLALAALLFQNFRTMAGNDPGFDTTRTIVVTVSPGRFGYPQDGAAARYLDAAIERVRALPGVRAAAVTTRAPMAMGLDPIETVSTSDKPCTAATATASASASTSTSTSSGDCSKAGIIAVGPGYFDALGIPLIAGNGFRANESIAAQRDSVIISARLASTLFPAQSPIGAWLRIGGAGRAGTDQLARVRGVAREANHVVPADDRRAEIYRLITPAEQQRDRVQIIVRASTDPTQILGSLRDAIRAVDPSIPIDSMQTMPAHLELPFWMARTLAGFSVICATLALALATVGLFGVVHRNVAQRQHEFGIRQALGAAPGTLVSLVLREGVWLALPGVTTGLVAAYLLAHAGASLVRGISVSATAPSTFLAVAALQAIATLAACLLPARRAATTNPLQVLRAD